MANKAALTDIVEQSRKEILYAIKMRIAEVTNTGSGLVQLKGVVIRDNTCRYDASMKYFEINNVFVDDTDCLCGDLAGKEDRKNVGVLFGKSIEDLAIDDLKQVLDALYGNRWIAEAGEPGDAKPYRRPGFLGLLSGTRDGISRALRSGARI